MNYPDYLLPNNNYKYIQSNVDDLCLIRHSHLPQDELVDEDTGRLKNKVIAMGAEKILPDYSISLYGIFRTKDIEIKITNTDYLVYCDPRLNVEAPVYNIDFSLEKNRGYWSIIIGDVNNKIITYDDNSLEARCVVTHTPMKWNYWHFSINWYLYNIEGYWHENKDTLSKSIRRKLGTEARSLLKEYSNPGIMSDKIIEEESYLLS